MMLTSTGVVSVKILILIIESRNFIPEFENISIVLGLVSFSLAMLLGTKLSIVNKRLFDLEDSITRIVAGIKVFWFTNKDIRPHLLKWINCFYNHIKNPTPDSASRMREENNWLYEKIGKVGINPNFVGLSRDAAFVLNKSVSEVFVYHYYGLYYGCSDNNPWNNWPCCFFYYFFYIFWIIFPCRRYGQAPRLWRRFPHICRLKLS